MATSNQAFGFVRKIDFASPSPMDARNRMVFELEFSHLTSEAVNQYRLQAAAPTRPADIQAPVSSHPKNSPLHIQFCTPYTPNLDNLRSRAKAFHGPSRITDSLRIVYYSPGT